jgi:hypothetical protein
VLETDSFPYPGPEMNFGLGDEIQLSCCVDTKIEYEIPE